MEAVGVKLAVGTSCFVMTPSGQRVDADQLDQRRVAATKDARHRFRNIGVAARLFAVAATPEKMLELGEPRLREFIKTIGLYRTKARNIIALSE